MGLNDAITENTSDRRSHEHHPVEAEPDKWAGMSFNGITMLKQQGKAICLFPPRLIYLPADVDAIYELMGKTIELLEGASIRYHVICGTALGLARHGGFIPWDNDVDLGIHVQDAEKVYALRDEFASAGYDIVRADIGFKCGSGDLIHGVMQSSPNGLQATGPANPFTGVNQVGHQC